MALITDPDQLNQATEVVIDTGAKTIQLAVAGNLSADGVTGKAVYSFFKEEWKNDPALIKFEFPFVPITDEFFELQEGWNWLDQSTRNLIRRSGFLVRDLSGNVTEHWAGVAILDAEADDQIYYQLDGDTAPTDFVYTGPTAEVVQVIDDPNGDGNYVDGFNKSANITVFNREQGQLFSSGSTVANGESNLLAPKLFSIGLPTGADLNVIETDGNISTQEPYLSMGITYLAGNGFTTAAEQSYSIDDVVQDGAGRWAICTVGGTLDAAGAADYTANGGTGTFAAFTGERQIGASYYAFGIIIEGNAGTAEEIYEFERYQLRQNADIDDGAGTTIGQLAEALLQFTGGTGDGSGALSTLEATNPQGDGDGVYIDNFQAADTNRITFTDTTGTGRTFPFVAGLYLNFNSTLVADADAIYRVFYTDANGNNFGDSDAILVDDNSDVDMAGTVSGAQIFHDFDYDGNAQGGRTPGTDAAVTVVALGLNSAQYAVGTGTITRSVSNQVSLVAATERNYENPT